jgi:hypothetical protein
MLHQKDFDFESKMNSIPLAEALLLLNIKKKISKENQSQMIDSIVHGPPIFDDNDSKRNSSEIAATPVNSGHTKNKLTTPQWAPTLLPSNHVWVPLSSLEDDPELLKKGDDASAGVMENIAATFDNANTKGSTPLWKPTPVLFPSDQWLPLSSLENDSDLMKKSDASSASVTATTAATSDSVKTKVTISTPLWKPTANLFSTPKVRRSSLSSLSSSSSSSVNISDGPGSISTLNFKRNDEYNIEENDKKRAKRIVAKSDYDDQCFCKIVADYGFEKINLALEKYKEINGDLFVERNFTVPRSTLWPEETWDINLGNVVTGIKVGTLSFFRRKEFLKLGLIVRHDRKHKDSNGTSRHNERQLNLISLGLITESK